MQIAGPLNSLAKDNPGRTCLGRPQPVGTSQMNPILETLRSVAEQPYQRAIEAKQRGQRVVGTLPMHCPAELIHAAGALPVLVQELPDPITSGGGVLPPFFCGFTRSFVDQVTEGKIAFLDAILFVDHCVQLLSAADVVRVARPETTIHFHQLIASVEQPWSLDNSVKTLRTFVEDLEELYGISISEDDLRRSIRLFNENRQLIRQLYDLRRSGAIDLSSTQMQAVIKSSMVMDKAEHTAMLRDLLPMLQAAGSAKVRKLPLYVSGHMCHAPRPEILALIEECGFSIVDDDLYHGYRYVSTDVDEAIGDPIVGLATAYLTKNRNAPCPTRIAPSVEMSEWLLQRVQASQARGLIVLLAKFCEPHYFQYPRIKQQFEQHNLSHLLVETEHEGVPLENLRTKVESFAEMIKRQG